MAKTKSGGSTRLGRDSSAQYLGVKLYAGEKAKSGSIIIRQRGTKYIPGKNVRRGKDDTLYAVRPGLVKFGTKTKINFNRKKRRVKVVEVV